MNLTAADTVIIFDRYPLLFSCSILLLTLLSTLSYCPILSYPLLSYPLPYSCPILSSTAPFVTSIAALCFTMPCCIPVFSLASSPCTLPPLYLLHFLLHLQFPTSFPPYSLLPFIPHFFTSNTFFSPLLSLPHFLVIMFFSLPLLPSPQ